MKNEHLFTLTMLATLLAFSAPAWATPDCNETTNPDATSFEGNVDNTWDNDNNWSNGTPNSSKTACIPPNKLATLGHDKQGHAKHIWIKADAVNTGKVIVAGDNDHDSSLTLYGDSTIDGDLEVSSSGHLKIDGQLTIDGVGRLLLITQEPDPGLSLFPTIEGTDPAAQLTLLGANAGSWTPDQWDDQNGTLVLAGGGDINVALVNRAHVTTWNDDLVSTEDMRLAINKSSSGDGFWIAEIHDLDAFDQGTLDVTAAVTGSGTWVVASSCPNPSYPSGCTAELRINAAMTSLTGDVLIYDGTFLVRENFTTEGNFTIQDDGTTSPQVIVRQGNVARFNVDPP